MVIGCLVLQPDQKQQTEQLYRPKTSYKFVKTKSVETYQGVINYEGLDPKCMRAFHIKWLGSVNCELPATCGESKQIVVDSTWYSSKIVVCLGDRNYILNKIKSVHYEIQIDDKVELITQHLYWVTTTIENDKRNYYAFLPKTFLLTKMRDETKKMRHSSDWSSFCMYEDREDIYYDWVIRRAEKKVNIEGSWALTRKARVPLLIANGSTINNLTCKQTCTRLRFNDTHDVCREVWESPSISDLCVDVLKLRETKMEHDHGREICIRIGVGNSNVFKDFFDPTNLKELTVKLLKEIVIELCTLLAESLELVIPAVIEGFKVLLQTAWPYLSQLKTYAIEKDKEYYVIENFIKFTVVSYRANWIAGILITIVSLSVIGCQRHYTSVTEFIELS